MNETRILEMGKSTQEFDKSLNDFIDRVRTEFSRQFARPMGDSGYGEYIFPTDVFSDYIVARQGDNYYRVTMEVADDSITFAPRRDWQPVRLSYVTEMPLTQFNDVLFISEFRGKYPDVPISEGIDYNALIEGDDDPVFVTLPIGKINAKSGNKRFYDEAFVTELERQVIANKPIGLMGHLSAEQRATEFPAEAVHWVGAMRVGELLWGKGYLPKGEARARVQRYKATKKQIATSIDAMAEGVWDEAIGAYRMQAKTLKLSQIDIAPADRAGISDLAAIPHLTTEMVNGVIDQQKKDDPSMDKLQAIRELTAEDIKLLPDSVRNAILAGAPEVALVQELRTVLDLPAGADIKAHLANLRTEQEKQRKDAIKARVRELVEDAEKGVKIVALRGMITEMIRLRDPQTVAEVDGIFTEVVASDAVKAALTSAVQETMGPNQTVQHTNGQPGKPKYYSIPEA